MPLPSLRFSLRRLIVLLVLAAAGFAGWYFVIRDEAGSSDSSERAAKKEREPISDDPVVRKMSVVERVQQTLLLGFEGSPESVPGELGAVLVRAENGVGAAKALAKGGGDIPRLVVASHEGGIYRSFPDLPPGERELDIGRSSGAAKAALAWARTTSQALANAGFDLNLFPVADVATLDSALAGRSFSDDPAQVAVLTEQAIKGCEQAGLACAPLHFPGRGAASQDTATGPATVASAFEVLDTRDLVPFRAIAKEAPAMVLSLALYPDFDAITPAAMTPGIATGLLRDEVGFKGLAITDDLSSGAITATFDVSDAAVQALAAGSDLIQVSTPEDAAGVAEAIERAVADGDVSEERLAEAAERVVALKRELGLVD